MSMKFIGKKSHPTIRSVNNIYLPPFFGALSFPSLRFQRGKEREMGEHTPFF